MALLRPSDVGELGVVAQLGGAEREACVGHRRGHEGLVRGEGRLEGVRDGGVARLGVGEDGGRGQDSVLVVVVVGRRWRGVRADAQRHLVDQGAPLRVREAVPVLQQGRRPGRQQVGVGAGGGGVGQQCVSGQGRGVGGASVRQVAKGVSVHRGRDVGVRPQRPSEVAVPLLAAAAAVVRGERRHLWQRTQGGGETRGFWFRRFQR